MSAKGRRVRAVALKLERSWGAPKRKRRNPLDTLISGILSQNTNDNNRDRAYASLRERFPTWDDVLRADSRAIARAIRVAGLANQRARRIKAVLRWVRSSYGELRLDSICDMSPVEATDRLTALKGVGVKTARVVLLFACGMDLFPVDTHILRVSKRLGFLPARCSSERAHRIMGGLVPRGKAHSLHLNLIRLGRTVCKPGRPRCGTCPIARWCDYPRDRSYRSMQNVCQGRAPEAHAPLAEIRLPHDKLKTAK